MASAILITSFSDYTMPYVELYRQGLRNAGFHGPLARRGSAPFRHRAEFPLLGLLVWGLLVWGLLVWGLRISGLRAWSR